MTRQGATAPVRYTVELPHRPMSNLDGLNARYGHPMQRARRVKWWRDLVPGYLFFADWPTDLPENGRGWRVAFCISMARGEFDTDNLESCCKPIRDEVAHWLGVNDKPGGVEWAYQQHRGPNGMTITLERVFA